MFKWGIIGTGVIADTRFAPALRDIPGTSLVAVYDPDRNRAEAFADKHNALHVYSDSKELCMDRDIDGVYIASPNHFHAEHTILAAHHKKHILCEKPMALNLLEAEEMVRAAEEAGTILAIGYMMPFHGSHRLMKDLLDNHILGKISLVKSDYLISLPYFQGTSFTVNQFRLQKEFGGGVIMDLAPHCINTIRFIMGSEVRSIISMYGALRFDCDADDTAVLLVKYSNGAIGVISLSFATEWGRNGIEFYGERGALYSEQSLSQIPEGVVRSYIEGAWTEYKVDPYNPYVQEIKHFIECVNTGQKPISSGEMGIADMRVIEAAWKSMLTGQRSDL